MIIIHTAEIKPSAHERIIEASLNKRDIDQEVKQLACTLSRTKSNVQDHHRGD
jgi:hypothetical protein